MSDNWDDISVGGDDFENENDDVEYDNSYIPPYSPSNDMAGEINDNFEHDFHPPPNLSDNNIEEDSDGEESEGEDALDILGLGGGTGLEQKEVKEEKEGKKSDDLTPTQKDEIGYLARYLYGKGIKIDMILTDIQVYILSKHPLLRRFEIKDLSSITKYLETYDYKKSVEIPDEKELKSADNFIGEVIHFYIKFMSRSMLNIINDKTQSYEIQDDILNVINLKGNLDIYNSIPFRVKVYIQENLPEMVRNYIKRHTVSKADNDFYKRIFKYEIVMKNKPEDIVNLFNEEKIIKNRFQKMYLDNYNLVRHVDKHDDFSNSKYSRLYAQGVYSILNINFEQMIDEIKKEIENEGMVKLEINTKEFTDNILKEIRNMSLEQRKKVLKSPNAPNKSLKKFMNKLLMKTTDPVFLGMYMDVLEKEDYALIDMIRNTILYILGDISKKTESKSKYTDKSSSFDSKVCTNETDLMGDPLTMNRNLVMVSIIKEREMKGEKKWKISTVECYLHDEISRIIKDSGVYLWNVKSETCCGNRAFKVVKSTYLGLWLDGKIEFMSPFNTFIVYDPLDVKIGSSFGVSALHGADEKVYDVKPVNRELVYCNDSTDKKCEILIGNEYIPKIEDFRESFFSDVSNFVQKEFKDGNYTGELIDGKRENFGFMIDKEGMIFAGLWKDDKFIKGFVSNNEFSRLYNGQVKDGKPNGRGKMITCNYFYDGIFKNGVFVKGKLAEKMSGDLYEGSFHNNEFQGTITILFHQDYSKKKRTVHLNNFKNLDDEKILEITDYNYKNINRSCKYKEVHVNIKGRMKDIEFLRGLPITKIQMEFNGDLSPLKGAPISDILIGSLGIYNKDDFIAKLKNK